MPLTEAASKGSVHDVKAAIEEKRINPNVFTSLHGGRAIHIAAEKGHTEIVSYLLSKGADPNLPGGSFDQTALNVAAQSGQVGATEVLLQSGKVKIEDDRNNSALIDAKTLSIAKILVEAGADLSYIDRWRRGCLTEPIRRRDMATLNYLLAKGAPVRSPANYLAQAAGEGNNEVLQILVGKGGDVNEIVPPFTYRFESTSPIHAAVRRPETLKWLLSHKADVNLENNHKNTALHLACRAQLPSSVAILLKAGADIHARDSIGRTPLHLLISGGERYSEEVVNQDQRVLECLATLLKFGASPNATDINGWTPLFRAATEGDFDLALKLVQAGADPKLKDVKGRSAIDLALEFGHAKLANQMEKGK